MSIRILLCDDHPVVLDGLKDMLSGQEDFEVLGEARDGEEAVALTRRLNPDVVLMDLQMPGMDGVVATKRIGEERPEVRVLVLTTYESDADILPAIEAGAAGYLLKDTPKEELFGAIRAVSEGKSWLSPSVADRLRRRMQRPGEALSAREIEALRLVSRGMSNKEIARELWISKTTVTGHLSQVFGKLGASDRTSAVTEALKRGIIRLDE